ncbi:hypothetical protein M0805_001001 [Coniferiporia weirii]|nr:hypothetical protein M0805_001001 [Coniferiporia weirii]
MASPMSSVNLSILSFALSSWLDGSAQLRRSLILFPLELGGATSVHPNGEPPSPPQPDAGAAQNRFVDKLLQWLVKPARDMDEAEKALLGALDVSSSILLLRLLGSGPILPFILNPLSITLALPQKLSIGPVKWTQVLLMCTLLSTLHEVQRTSVAAGLTWLRLQKAASSDTNVGEVILRGEKLPARSQEDLDADSEGEEECVICSGVGYDAPLPDASAGGAPSLGPLETFCVHAPAKHPMHRACFAAWKDAYWDARATHTSARPVIALSLDGEGADADSDSDSDSDVLSPHPGTQQWLRAQAVLAALGTRVTRDACLVPLASARRVGGAFLESVFTLRDPGVGARAGAGAALGSLVSAWPPCPGCRSSVKMVFARAPKDRSAPGNGGGMPLRMVRVWITSWKRLVTGRTILVKTATNILFALFLVSMMRIRKSHAQRLLLSRQVL